MFSPEYMCPFSLVRNKTKVMGNVELATEIEEHVKDYIEKGCDLYHCQELIKAELTERFGVDWYERSGEAVNFLIENWYANEERHHLPAFDMNQYKYDLAHGVLY